MTEDDTRSSDGLFGPNGEAQFNYGTEADYRTIRPEARGPEVMEQRAK